jgi:SpoVK/Ycf46/Vps4 family AAA+-type ATPase
MRIQPIGNYYYHQNYINQNKPVQAPTSMTYADKSLYRTQEKPCPVSFTSLQNRVIELAKTIPLEERLASLFSTMKDGDLILSGKSFGEAQKDLVSVSAGFKDIIRRIIYVEDEKLSGSLIFWKDGGSDLALVNPNESDIILSAIGAKGEKIAIERNRALYVSEGDVISLDDKEVEIKLKSEANIKPYQALFSKVFDLKELVEQGIQNINLKSIVQIAKSEAGEKQAISFKDIGGQDKVINALKKGIIYPVKYPEAYENNIVNRGFILYGPPGTGKTLLAQALASEAGASFIKLNGLEMESKFVGESEQNWRNLFALAKQHQPCILFIDEFDAIAKKRGGIDTYGDKVVNQLLTIMSDIEKNNDNIFVVTATNKIDLLDDAITRSGRFGKHIEVKAPDNADGILQIFNIHTKEKPVSNDLDKDALAKTFLAKHTTGADIAYIVNTANENAFERCGIYEKMENGTFSKDDLNTLQINQVDFDKALASFDNKSTQRTPIGYAQKRN